MNRVEQWLWIALGVGLLLLAAVLVAKPDRPGGVTVTIDTSADSVEAIDTIWKMPDAPVLALAAERAGVPPAFALSMAWEETRSNVSPSVRGAHHEWGRFQIQPATAASRCPGLDIRTYDGNVACAMKMLRADWERHRLWRTVARAHNGQGPPAEAYADRVMARAR